MRRLVHVHKWCIARCIGCTFMFRCAWLRVITESRAQRMAVQTS
jgi:hypothetical protein